MITVLGGGGGGGGGGQDNSGGWTQVVTSNARKQYVETTKLRVNASEMDLGTNMSLGSRYVQTNKKNVRLTHAKTNDENLRKIEVTQCGNNVHCQKDTDIQSYAKLTPLANNSHLSINYSCLF